MDAGFGLHEEGCASITFANQAIGVLGIPFHWPN